MINKKIVSTITKIPVTNTSFPTQEMSPVNQEKPFVVTKELLIDALAKPEKYIDPNNIRQ